MFWGPSWNVLLALSVEGNKLLQQSDHEKWPDLISDRATDKGTILVLSHRVTVSKNNIKWKMHHIYFSCDVFSAKYQSLNVWLYRVCILLHHLHVVLFYQGCGFCNLWFMLPIAIVVERPWLYLNMELKLTSVGLLRYNVRDWLLPQSNRTAVCLVRVQTNGCPPYFLLRQSSSVCSYSLCGTVTLLEPWCVI